MVSERKITVVNARNMQLDYSRLLNETVLVFLYGNETLVWREKEV